MSRIYDLITNLCPSGVEFCPLDELLNYEQPGKYLVESTEYDDDFPTPVLTAGQTFILGYTNETQGIYLANKERPVIIFDDFTTAFKWVDFPFKAKSSAMKMLTPKSEVRIDFKYVYYAMLGIHFSPQNHARHWIAQYSGFRIPLPPLEVQQEIRRILDLFMELEAELEAELEGRQRQYDYYRRTLLTFPKVEVQTFPLSELCEISRGRVISRDYLRDHAGPFPVYSSQTQNNGIFGYIDSYAYDFESITWTTDGANAGSVFYHVNEKFSITNVCGLLRVKDNTRCSTKFLFYQLAIHAKKYVSEGMGNPKLMANAMSAVSLSIPPLEEQKRIESLLDKFDALVNDPSVGLPAELVARRKQYEYYRDHMLTFEETVA